MNKQVRTADLSLVLVALLWGIGFIGVQYSINSMLPVSLILAGRFTLGAIAVMAFSFKTIKTINKKELFSGVGAGLILFLSFFLQTAGQSRTSISNSAFITAIYVIFVPFIIWIITKKPPKKKMFFLVFTTLIGVFILTYEKEMTFDRFSFGDFLVLLCALGFALHIVYLGIKTKDLDPIKITFLQLATAGICGFLFFAASGNYSLSKVDWHTAIIAILYLGLISTAVCYYLQTWAQTITSPSKAGIIMSCESLFGSLFAIIIGLDNFRINIIIGGLIIMSSVILSEVDFSKKNK